MIRRLIAAIALACVAAPSLAQDAPVSPALTNVVMQTELGDIVIALEVQRAPITAANFLRYVDAKRLDGTRFYRAMRLDWGDQPNGLVQGGLQNDPARLFTKRPARPG
ncbi:MAG: hypothetical protein RLZZ08_1650 [Pseudomonadota bacterium]|jgi:peptidyl-prolyl cis-trans isomerase A (cyclophilin A)